MCDITSNFSQLLNNENMIKVLAITLTIGGAISLVFGVLGIFGSFELGLSPWALAILGVIFFLSGISLLKYHDSNNSVD